MQGLSLYDRLLREHELHPVKDALADEAETSAAADPDREQAYWWRGNIYGEDGNDGQD